MRQPAYLDGAFVSANIGIKNYTNSASIIALTARNDSTEIFSEFKLIFFDASIICPTITGGVLTDEYGNVMTGEYNHYLHFTDGSTGAEQAIYDETYFKAKHGLNFYLWTDSWHRIQAPLLIYQISANDQLIFDRR